MANWADEAWSEEANEEAWRTARRKRNKRSGRSEQRRREWAEGQSVEAWAQYWVRRWRWEAEVAEWRLAEQRWQEDLRVAAWRRAEEDEKIWREADAWLKRLWAEAGETSARKSAADDLVARIAEEVARQDQAVAEWLGMGEELDAEVAAWEKAEFAAWWEAEELAEAAEARRDVRGRRVVHPTLCWCLPWFAKKRRALRVPAQGKPAQGLVRNVG